MISLVFPKLNSILFGQFFSEMQRSLDAELIVRESSGPPPDRVQGL